MTFEEAVALAAEAHRGQTDLAGLPYLAHALRVGLATLRRTGSVDAAVVGVLHDVVEDSDVTIADLRRRGLTEEQLRALDAVTKRDGEAYCDRVTRILREGGPVAKAVKLCDLEDNMDLSRFRGRHGGFRVRDAERVNDYLAAHVRLTGG